MKDTPEKRPVKRRRKKRKKSPKVIIGIIILILALSAGAACALTAPGLKVSEVYCEGNNYTDSAEIIAAADIQTGKNIFLVNTGKAERNTEKISIVKNATVERVFPNKICIKIEERTPYANLQCEGNYIGIDSDGIVLKIYEGADAVKISECTKPVFETKSEEKTDSEKKADTEDKNTDEDIDEDTDDSKDSDGIEELQENKESEEEIEEVNDNKGNASEEKPQEEVQPEAQTEKQAKIYNVPVVTGFETEAAEEGEKIKSKDEVKYNKAMEICKALSESGLLGRCTHIDLSNMGDIRLTVEGRLDIRMGTCENISYKAMFLTEVIDKKISSTERVIMDYKGNDIYVRANEDGKQRVKQIKKTEDESKTENSEENNKNSEDDDEVDSEGENREKTRKNEQNVNDEE